MADPNRTGYGAIGTEQDMFLTNSSRAKLHGNENSKLEGQTAEN